MALHLGARRVLAVSTRYSRTEEDVRRTRMTGPPPPAQVAGIMLNAIFLDLLDQDVDRLDRQNRLLRQAPVHQREGLREVKLLALRPSRDLSRIAGEYEPQLPSAFRYLTRGLGTRESASPDLLSLLMFQPDYLWRLIEIGEADAEARADEIAALIAS